MPSYLLDEMAKAIFSGDNPKAAEVFQKALDDRTPVEDILLKGVIKAWENFSEWYDRDPNGALKRWYEIYKATYNILRALERKIPDPEKTPFDVMVMTVKGEGHVLVRDLLPILLRAKGLKVHYVKRGVLIEDISERLPNPALRFVILSCTQDDVKPATVETIRKIKERRPDIGVVAGGVASGDIGADVVVSHPSKLFETLLARSSA